MSRDASVDITWADGDYRFRLAWKQIIELQEKTDSGPYVTLQRLVSGQWRVEDISNVIRLGLIGGGMTPADALKKVRTYVEDRPPLENVIIAQTVLTAALMGAPDESLGEAEGEVEEKSTTSPTEKSE
jgi:hypothetical protein